MDDIRPGAAVRAVAASLGGRDSERARGLFLEVGEDVSGLVGQSSPSLVELLSCPGSSLQEGSPSLLPGYPPNDLFQLWAEDQNSALESRPNASLKISTKPQNLTTSGSLKQSHIRQLI